MMATTLSADDAATLTAYLERTSMPVEEGTRERIIAACELVIMSLRIPIGTARKNAFLTLDQAAIRTAIGLNLFSILSALCETSARIVSTTELAAKTTPPCEPVLLKRLLRYLAQPLGLVLKQGPDEWSISTSGRSLACEGFGAACKLYSDACGPAFRALPSWIATSSSDSCIARPPTAFKAAMPQVEGGFFDFLREDADGLQSFHTWMETLAQYQYDCQQKVDFGEWIPASITSAETAFVDIGGGSGKQCITLRQKCGEVMQGRIVNQDRDEVIAEVDSKLGRNGVQTMAHDFFAEQPIKGMFHARSM
jgi:hypothetical protein